MTIYDTAKTSMDVENFIINELGFASINDARIFREPGENIYEITIEIKQIEPPL